MSSLPLTIACLVALLPIRLTICGDPLIWASIEAQAEFKMKPDGGPGGDCSLPGTFQMRADGSWLPSSEFEFTGNFDEDCGIYLHLTIPEDEPEGGEEFRTKIKQLNKEKEELQKEEDKLTSEKKEHEAKMEELRKAKKLRDALVDKLKVAEKEKNDLNKKSVDISEKRNSLTEKLKPLDLSDLNSAIAEIKEKGEKITKYIADAKAREILLKGYLYGVCSKIPNSLYFRITGTAGTSGDTKVYICHAKGPNYGAIIEEIWNSEIARVEEEKKGLKDDMGTIDSEESKLKDERSTHEGDMKKLAKEKVALDEKKVELATIRSGLENQEARKKVVNARRIDLEDKKNMLGEYTDEDLLEKKESELSQEKSRLVKKMKLFKELLRLYEGNDCTQIPDSDYFIIKDEVNVHRQDILVCEPEQI